VVSQIEVSFDVDSNGIMTVTAVEKASGSSKNITITNDKGRLSKEDIDRMVREAESFKSEDEATRRRIEAKNQLENYAYSLKNTLNDSQVASKLSDSDKTTLNNVVSETLRWLESNQLGEADEYQHRQQELESIAMPIMQKMYASAGAGAGGAGGANPGFNAGAGHSRANTSASTGPSVEEVD